MTREERQEQLWQNTVRQRIESLLEVVDPSQQLQWRAMSYKQLVKYASDWLKIEGTCQSTTPAIPTPATPSTSQAAGTQDLPQPTESAKPWTAKEIKEPDCSNCGKLLVEPYISAGNNVFYCNRECLQEKEHPVLEVCYFCSSSKPPTDMVFLVADFQKRPFCKITDCYKEFQGKVPQVETKGLSID